MQEIIQKGFRVEKVIKKKVINYMSIGKATIIPLIDRLIEKILSYTRILVVKTE